MNREPLPLDETAETLRTLAMAAAPAVRADPELARTVLARAAAEGSDTPDRPAPSWHAQPRRGTSGAVVPGGPVGNRRRRLRRAMIGVGGGALVLGTLAAATLLGRGDYYTVTQPSSAMEQTVHVGDRVVLHRKLVPTRGDVVTVRLRRDGREYDAMMRVLALGGDTVGCPADAYGRCAALVVNGAAVAEPYLGTSVTDPFPVRTVPAGTLFLLGDNRPVANDSRYIGPVRVADVTGVAVRIRGRDGQVRPVPGAPAHDRPGDRNNVDPAGPVPPAEVAEPG